MKDLEEFTADIGFVGRDCASAAVHSVFYSRHRIFVVVNRRHRLALRRGIRLEELEGEDMIVRTSSSTTQGAFDRAAAARGVTPEPVFEIESREGLREAVIRGLGIGVISETEFAPHPELRPLLVTDSEMFTRAYITCLKSRRSRPLIRDFLQLAASAAENCET